MRVSLLVPTAGALFLLFFLFDVKIDCGVVEPSDGSFLDSLSPVQGELQNEILIARRHDPDVSPHKHDRPI